MKLDDLKNFDLNKINLSNIDLKDLDINKIKFFLVEQKRLVAKIAVILVSVFMLFSMVGGYNEQMTAIKKNMVDLGDKAGVIAQYEEIQTKSKSFIENLPKDLDEDFISNEISDYATKNNIVVSSIVQGERKMDNFSSKINIQLSFTFKRYVDFLNLIKSIDNSPYSFKIGACLLTSKDGAESAKDGNLPVEVKMTIVYTEIRK